MVLPGDAHVGGHGRAFRECLLNEGVCNLIDLTHDQNSTSVKEKLHNLFWSLIANYIQRLK